MPTLARARRFRPASNAGANSPPTTDSRHYRNPNAPRSEIALTTNPKTKKRAPQNLRRPFISHERLRTGQFLLRLFGLLWLHDLKDHGRAVFRIGEDVVPGVEASQQHLFRKRIFDVSLNRSAQRSRTQVGIVAVLHQD